MAAAPQMQPPSQQPVPSGSSTAGPPEYHHPQQHPHHPFHHAQPPLYQYSTPPLYQNHGYLSPSSSSSNTASIPPPSFPSNQFFPGPSQNIGLPQHPYPRTSPGLGPSVPMTAVATHYQPPPFDLVGVPAHPHGGMAGVQANTVSEEGWEDTGSSKPANERFYSGGRQRTPVEAARIFEQQYQICNKPTKEIRASLSQQSGLPLRTVQIWFQNRRAKDVLEAKRAVMAQAAAASAAAVAAGLPPPPPPAFPPARRQVMRHSSDNGVTSDATRTPSDSKSKTNSGSGSASISSVSTTPDVGPAPLPESTPSYTFSEAGPSSAPPVMAPNNQIMYSHLMMPSQNPALYGYAYPSVGAAAVGGPLCSPARMGRRSSIANCEAANISTIVQRQQRGSIGAANAARRGSIPYPPSIHSALVAANANSTANGSVPLSPHHQAHRNGGHTVAGGGLGGGAGVMSSPLSPRGSASHLAKTALRNNSRRASMPVNGGLQALPQSVVVPNPSPGLGVTAIVPSQAFTPPRTVSGTGPAAPLPSDGRVTRELPPSTDQSDQAQAKAALLPQMPGSAGQDMPNGTIPEFDPSLHTPTRSSGNAGVFTMQSQGSNDGFVQPLAPFDPFSQIQVQNSNSAMGPLPNPTFVFGNAHSQGQATSQHPGMINYGIDETFLSMQDRSRLNSLASIGTYASELSSEFGSNGFDYLPVPEGLDLYTRRASAPADLIDGMGLVGLNPMAANPANQPIRPSPLGQTHSSSSDQLRTQATLNAGQAQGQGNMQYHYGYNVGLGLPPNGLAVPASSSGPTAQSQSQSQSHTPVAAQHSGSTSPTDYPQPTAQWNPALSFAPLVSRETSNSTDNIYTPSSFFPPSSTDSSTANTNANSEGSGNGTGLDPASFDAQDWLNLGINLSQHATPQGQGQHGTHARFTLPHLNSSEFLASLDYADRVVPEEDEEEEKEERLNLAFPPDQIDHLVLQP